jgi:hypothetical protein
MHTLGVAGKLKMSLDILDRFWLSFFYTNFREVVSFTQLSFSQDIGRNKKWRGQDANLQ